MNRQRYRQCQRTNGRTLFAKMEERADHSPDFAAQLDHWIAKGSTLELRELARPEGWHFDDLAHANAIDALDSWSLHPFTFQQESVQ
jgi:hypothetical protein